MVKIRKIKFFRQILKQVLTNEGYIYGIIYLIFITIYNFKQYKYLFIKWEN